MNEAALVRRIVAAIKQRHPTAIAWKLNDRFTRGLPDLLVVVEGKVVGLEAKTPAGVQSAIQRVTQQKMVDAGAVYAVVRSIDESLDAIETALHGEPLLRD